MKVTCFPGSPGVSQCNTPPARKSETDQIWVNRTPRAAETPKPSNPDPKLHCLVNHRRHGMLSTAPRSQALVLALCRAPVTRGSRTV